MVDPQFPARFYNKGEELKAWKSINHYAGMNLLSRLETVLHRDEWEYLCNSPLGVFIKFYKMKFGWSSRIVHYMLTSQLVCDQRHEIWCLIGVKPVRFSLNEFQEITELNCEYIDNLENPIVEVTREIQEFWGKLGVPVDVGPSINSLIAACASCESWTQDERIKLGFLSIYASFIDSNDHKLPTRVGMARLVMDLAAFESYPWGRVAFKKLIKSVKKANLANPSYTLQGFLQVLQVWVYYALPDFGAEYGRPILPAPRPILLSYKGNRVQNITADALLKQERVQNFVVKDYEDMFPHWDGDVKDDKIVNIVKAFFGKFGHWTFTSAHWLDEGVKSSKVVPNNKKNIDSGEESRKKKKKKTLISSEKEVPTLKNGCSKFSREINTLTKAVNTLTKKVDTLNDKVQVLELTLEELRQGPTIAADGDDSPTVSLLDFSL